MCIWRTYWTDLSVDESQDGSGISKPSNTSHESEANACHGTDEEWALEVAGRKGIFVNLECLLIIRRMMRVVSQVSIHF